MPEIRQYEQQVSPQGPVGTQRATSEDFGGGAARAMGEAGQSLGNLGTAIQDRANQKDVANVHAKIANAQNQLGLQMQDQLQKGTLNHDDFMKSVSDSMDAIQQQVETSAGSLRFKQLAAETNLELSQKAQAGQAHLAGVEAVQQVDQASDARTSYVFGDPTQFKTSLQQQNQAIDDMVALHGLPAEHAPELKRLYMDKLAQGAIRGQARINPDEAQNQVDSGKWDSYLSEGSKAKMYSVIEHAKSAQYTEQLRKQKVIDDAKAAVQEQVKGDWYNKLYGNGLSTNDIMWGPDSGKVDEATKEHFNALIEKRQSDKISTDNPMMRDLMNQIYLPEGDPKKTIHSQDDLNKYYINGSINHEGLRILRAEFTGKGTVQGDADNQLSKNFYQMMYQAIAKPDPITKMPDPDGAKAYQTWLADSLDQKQKKMAQGKRAEDLFNPKSPDYLGGNVEQYQRTPEQIMQAQIDRMTRENSTLPSPTPTPPTEQKKEDTVNVTSPQGKTGKIPKSAIQKYKALGYRFN